MKRKSRQIKRASRQPASKLVALISLVPLFAACDGANQGVQIGTGQNPDPVVIDFPIAYVKQPIPVDDNGEFEQQDLREQISFQVGGNLYYRDRASPSALEVNITEPIIGDQGDVRDVEIAFDGSKLLFSMRGPADPNLDLDDEDQPTWNLWEYEFETRELRRVIATDLTAENGHDIMPKYLPDGRIVFASTRQTRSQAILLDEGKGAFPHVDENRNEFAFNLHVIDSDGTGLEQVTFNQSHDLDPAVLDDGRVVFSRWDGARPNDGVDLYVMNPDGSNLELLYGKQSHDTGPNGDTVQFTQPRQLEDGRIMALIRPFTNSEGGGELITIDTAQYLENTQPTAPNIGILTGPAQEDATINDVLTRAGPSPGGRYGSAYPIQDGTGRLLVSWSQCRLIEVMEDFADPLAEPRIVPCTEERLAAVVEIDPDDPVTPAVGDFLVAPPLYGIWMYDPRDNTQLPVVPGEEGIMVSEVVAADPRPTPPTVLDGSNDFLLDSTLAENGEAVLNIRSVYDFDGTAVADIDALADPAQTLAAGRPARFLRIVKAVSQPDDDLLDIDNTAFGVSRANGMREIVGYTMIEPDGSVMVKVPANTALQVSVLDEDGERITPRHRNWISLVPGQELKCNGCHVQNSGLSHGRREAFDSAWAGAQTAGVEFPNTDPRWFVGDIGETMAEVRARVTCTNDGCSSLEPSMNIVYRDVWSADPAIAAQNADIDMLYTDLTTLLPTSLACAQDWSPNCRSVINYETVIHPLWSQPRLVFDDVGNPVVDPVTGLQLNNNCLNCHTPIDEAGVVRVPAGQLELQDGLSPDEPDHFHAYRELLATDNLQEVVNGALVDVQQQVDVDADGNPVFEPIPIASPATIAGAAASDDFFDRFEDPNDLHYNILSTAERRLIAEWLDVGAQYYNNPFDAPAN
jgi:Tol biopolymer transport system component